MSKEVRRNFSTQLEAETYKKISAITSRSKETQSELITRLIEDDYKRIVSNGGQMEEIMKGISTILDELSEQKVARNDAEQKTVSSVNKLISAVMILMKEQLRAEFFLAKQIERDKGISAKELSSAVSDVNEKTKEAFNGFYEILKEQKPAEIIALLRNE